METGVDEMRWDDLSKNHKQWPTVARVRSRRFGGPPLLFEQAAPCSLARFPCSALFLAFRSLTNHAPGTPLARCTLTGRRCLRR
jgi:hypothetical protein